MVDNVILLHGYSVRSLDNWGRLTQLLAGAGVDASRIYLSAFVSLDDDINCDDVAFAVEARVRQLVADGLDLRRTAVIGHSTGTIIARRWMLNRRAANADLPSHFLSFAGANHGSSLAQVGRTDLAKVFREVTADAAVGRKMLDDLDYGSAFLRRLNREWLKAWNDVEKPLPRETFCFSLAGGDHSYWQNQLLWQSREKGSDGTVRISAANLNYRLISVTPPYQEMQTVTMRTPAAHLVVDGPEKKYSHTSQAQPDEEQLVMAAAVGVADEVMHLGRLAEPVTATASGILSGIESVDERPYTALIEAFNVSSDDEYTALAQRWRTLNDAWSEANPLEVCSTIVVAVHDAEERLVEHSSIAIRDSGNGGLGSLSTSLTDHQPIRNEVAPSVVSFYVDYETFRRVHGHRIRVEASPDTSFLSYTVKVDSPLSDASDPESHVIAAGEFTYVEVTTERDASGALRFYKASDARFPAKLAASFPPFLDDAESA